MRTHVSINSTRGMRAGYRHARLLVLGVAADSVTGGAVEWQPPLSQLNAGGVVILNIFY